MDAPISTWAAIEAFAPCSAFGLVRRDHQVRLYNELQAALKIDRDRSIDHVQQQGAQQVQAVAAPVTPVPAPSGVAGVGQGNIEVPVHEDLSDAEQGVH